MRITVQKLVNAGATCEQVAIFKKQWPKGADVSLVNCRKAIALGLDLGWAAEYLLTAPAWKAYEEATAPALKAYKEATATAWKAHEEAKATAFFNAYKLS